MNRDGEDRANEPFGTRAIDPLPVEEAGDKGSEAPAGDVLQRVYHALAERGYDPIHQLVGYLLSGDPAYITSHGEARSLIRRVGRDELLEELVRNFVAAGEPSESGPSSLP